jgi:putative ABC transport system substrate-binding protein
MKRRAFISGLGCAAATWPAAARAQQPVMPAIGFLSSQSAETNLDLVRAFRQALRVTGHIEGENLAIEYRWAENQIDRLPMLVADLVRRRVAVIAVVGGPASAAVAKATSTIPIVFAVPEDPVALGLVASLARPGGNATGVNFFAVELAGKRLELLLELVPAAARLAILLNPAEAAIAAANLSAVETAARGTPMQIHVVRASTPGEIDAAFATFTRDRPDALFISSGPFFTSRRIQLAHQATRHALPAIHASRLYADVGGLMSYGTSQTETYRPIGAYAGSILNGGKPAVMPVVQSRTFELVINAQTARVLGLTVPPALLARADEVIE